MSAIQTQNLVKFKIVLYIWSLVLSPLFDLILQVQSLRKAVQALTNYFICCPTGFLFPLHLETILSGVDKPFHNKFIPIHTNISPKYFLHLLSHLFLLIVPHCNQ